VALAAPSNTVARHMGERETERQREWRRTHPAPPPLLRESHPILALQRAIGNRAVAQMLARAPATTGTVQIHGVGDIKVTGGNLKQWAGSEVPETVTVTSHKGKHSAKFEKLANAGAKTDIKLTLAPETKVGEELNVGGGTVVEIKGGRIEGYAVADGVESWRLAEFTNVHRTKITHRVA
jgi:hypothetical protein